MSGCNLYIFSQLYEMETASISPNHIFMVSEHHLLHLSKHSSYPKALPLSHTLPSLLHNSFWKDYLLSPLKTPYQHYSTTSKKVSLKSVSSSSITSTHVFVYINAIRVQFFKVMDQ